MNKEACLEPSLQGQLGDVTWASASSKGLQPPSPGPTCAILRDVPIADVPTLISAACAEPPSRGVCSGWFVALCWAGRSHPSRYWFGSFPHISTGWIPVVAYPTGCPVVDPAVCRATVITRVSCATCVRCVSCATAGDRFWLAVFMYRVCCVSCAIYVGCNYRSIVAPVAFCRSAIIAWCVSIAPSWLSAPVVIVLSVAGVSMVCPFPRLVSSMFSLPLMS